MPFQGGSINHIISSPTGKLDYKIPNWMINVGNLDNEETLISSMNHSL